MFIVLNLVFSRSESLKVVIVACSLSAHMYVLVFQDQHTLPKWNIPSYQIQYIACSLARLWAKRIFHFGRVCWSWKTNTYIWAEREQATMTALRQNISLWQRENKQLNGVFITFSLLGDSRAISLTKLIKCGFALRLHVSEFFKSVISY